MHTSSNAENGTKIALSLSTVWSLRRKMKRILVVVPLVLALVACTPGNVQEEDVQGTPVVAAPDREEVTAESVEAAKAGLVGAEFNPVEYLFLSQIEAKARVAKDYCGDVDELKARLQSVEEVTEVLVTHSAYLPNNAEMTEISLILRKNIQEFLARYRKDAERDAVPSQVYCELKMDLYIKAVRRALEASGQKVRR